MFFAFYQLQRNLVNEDYKSDMINYGNRVLDDMEKEISNFISTEIEWIPINNVIISKDIFDEISDFLDSLDNDDDVQNIFTNLKIGSN